MRGTGRWVDPKGYVWVRGPKGHPNAKRGNWIAEHVLVMSELLGRPLRDGESVHHRNLLKDDNRPENLPCLVARSQGWLESTKAKGRSYRIGGSAGRGHPSW